MPIARPIALALLATLAACGRGPSRDDALQAIRRAHPEFDTATVVGRVWQDGPPWFSCAEVLVKAASVVDSAAVRDQVGNWKPLVTGGWIALRDTASGPVADPGWCVVKLTDAGQARSVRWTLAPGAVQPTGQPRRGWLMDVGRRHVSVAAAPSAVRDDSASAEFLVIVSTNETGAALVADRDTAHYVAALARDGGRWRVTGVQPIRPGSRPER